MNQKQQPEQVGWAQGFNLAYMLLLVHQRGIVVPMRMYCGKEFYGRPCALAFLLMSLWAAFSRDFYMWLWVGLWLFMLLVRKGQSYRAIAQGARIHSEYDGVPAEALKYANTERAAKLFVEPFMVGLLGLVVLLIYKAAELPSLGLPYFLLFGVVSLPVVELVKQIIWEKRLQGMQDARIEQEAMVRDSRARYGE